MKHLILMLQNAIISRKNSLHVYVVIKDQYTLKLIHIVIYSKDMNGNAMKLLDYCTF